MANVYCQMLGDAIPHEVCGEEQAQRGCKNCKAPTRKCETCKSRPVTCYSEGICGECADPKPVEIAFDLMPTAATSVVAESLSVEPEAPKPSAAPKLSLIDKVRALRKLTKGPKVERSTTTVVGSTYSVSVGLRHVVYLTPAEFAVWNWIVAERREDDPNAEIMLPPGPRGLRRSDTQEPLPLTTKEYWEVVHKFKKGGLMEHVRTIGERMSYYRVRFNPAKYHVVRVPERMGYGLTRLERELIDTVQEGDFDVPEFSDVQVVVKEWLQERFPDLNSLRVRAKLVGYIQSSTHRSWGVLYLHGKSQRCLVCRKGFEPYRFFLAPELVSRGGTTVVEPPHP